MPSPDVGQRIRALKLRLDEVGNRYYAVRSRVYGKPGGKGDPDRRDRFSDPRADMLTLEGWIKDFCDAFDEAKPERGDEIITGLVRGPLRPVRRRRQPKEAGGG
ncbi:MAG TPA: hypothetical protein VM537_18730, partial [Anaerolineae bacterium]|nr:hypothetical protein [Anaerolineae bacterium]